MAIEYASPEQVKEALSTFISLVPERIFLPENVSLAQQEQLFALSGLITPELAKTHLPMLLDLVDHCTSTTESPDPARAQTVFETLRVDPNLKPNPHKFSEDELKILSPEEAASRHIVGALIYASNGKWLDIPKYWPGFMELINQSQN